MSTTLTIEHACPFCSREHGPKPKTLTWSAALTNLRAYRANCQWPSRVQAKREPKTAYDDYQLAEIEALKQRERDERHAKRMARLAARHSRGESNQ